MSGGGFNIRSFIPLIDFAERIIENIRQAKNGSQGACVSDDLFPEQRFFIRNEKGEVIEVWINGEHGWQSVAPDKVDPKPRCGDQFKDLSKDKSLEDIYNEIFETEEPNISLGPLEETPKMAINKVIENPGEGDLAVVIGGLEVVEQLDGFTIEPIETIETGIQFCVNIDPISGIVIPLVLDPVSMSFSQEPVPHVMPVKFFQSNSDDTSSESSLYSGIVYGKFAVDDDSVIEDHAFESLASSKIYGAGIREEKSVIVDIETITVGKIDEGSDNLDQGSAIGLDRSSIGSGIIEGEEAKIAAGVGREVEKPRKVYRKKVQDDKISPAGFRVEDDSPVARKIRCGKKGRKELSKGGEEVILDETSDPNLIAVETAHGGGAGAAMAAAGLKDGSNPISSNADMEIDKKDSHDVVEATMNGGGKQDGEFDRREDGGLAGDQINA